MAKVRTLITAEQLPEIARDQRVELVDGELVEMTPVGFTHGYLVPRLVMLLGPAAESAKAGVIVTEVGFVLSRNPDTVRAPDVAFISAERLGSEEQEGFFEGAPDLAIEVLSPGDRASEVQAKIREYLNAGSRLVLVVDPRTRTFTAHHPGGDAHVYGDNEAITLDLLPGFVFRPAELFRRN